MYQVVKCIDTEKVPETLYSNNIVREVYHEKK